jgi:hypothetical protein
MRIDFTLTLPGLFEVERIQELADEFDVDILAKVIFSFSPDIVMSPLALPRKLLDKKLDQLLLKLNNGALKDVVFQLKSRPVFAEQWPDTYQAGLRQGKQRVLHLESIRQDTVTLAAIVSADPDIKEWYDTIPT